MRNNLVWFITGASKGMGLTLTKKLLGKGFKVAATSRNIELLKEGVGESEDFLPIKLNLSDEEDVKQAIAQTISKFGQLHVVVNNAGYGQIGYFEEISDAKTRQNFEVNVFGTFNVVRQVLPQLRKQRFGRIVNFSSTAGFYGFGGSSIYAATKFAVDGFSESLSQDVEPFGVRVIAVKPGYFRTSFLSEESIGIRPDIPIDDYKQAREAQIEAIQQYDRNQPGDPEKGMDVLIKAVQSENPPLHLFLGKDAYEVAEQKILNVQKDLNEWRIHGTTTDFD
ncbi:short-chain dehydrogenase/reductase [Salipaludibacillus neizhouensis]|uniref:Short-chain dehydrogenase/reductase n=1 Tax=Salipaludibacillus neizhouensis TaxID=885475 RepID=A0A3A9K7B1_9BACI|nr:SDR family oxidoreductase [Salipaludibacillus neizhouensis]RKL66231.1 short-chain dehydrogenase/reductase [Salipaludibacillus neizhouensis]